MAKKKKLIYNEVQSKGYNTTWLGEIAFFYKNYGESGTGIEVSVGDREGSPLSRWTKLYDEDITGDFSKDEIEFEINGKIFPSEYKNYKSIWGYETNRNDIQDFLKGKDDVRYKVYLYVDAPPPGNISSINVPNSAKQGTNFNISWSTASDADFYRIEVKSNDDSWTLYSNESSSSASIYAKYTWNKVQFRVRAQNSSGNSDWVTSNVINIIDPEPPGTISYINTPSSVYQGNSISVSWGSSSKADKYRLEKKVDGGSWSLVTTTYNTSYSVSSSSSWNRVEFRVRGENDNGSGSWKYSDSVTINHPTPPSMPSSISLSISNIKSNSTFNVIWGTGSGASKYYLYRKVNGGSWVQIYSGSSREYEQTASKEWNTVEYRVRSYNSDGYSSYRESKVYDVEKVLNITVNIKNENKKIVKSFVKINENIKTVSNIYIKINDKIIEL